MEVSVRVSYFEIFNECVNDLLNEKKIKTLIKGK